MKEPSANFRNWKPHTTEKSANRDGVGYGLEAYQRVFGFTTEELRNSTVLDLGSGPTERLSKDIQNLNINCKVISVNPDYSEDPYLRQKVTSEGFGSKKLENKGSVSAIGQELPFPNGTFKFVFALNSISLYSGPVKDYPAAVLWTKEAFRVLQPKGKAYFFHNNLIQPIQEYINDIKIITKLLKDVGFIVATQDVQDTDKPAIIATKQ